jgi:hypothetical protein
MENTIGLSLLGILSIWLSVVILHEINQSEEATKWLLKKHQLRKINTLQNQNPARIARND